MSAFQPSVTQWIAIGLASGIGGVLRVAADLLLRDRAGTWTWGTLTVNLLGSFALGVVAGTIRDPALRLVVGSGLLGGFTTFSALSLQTVHLAQEGRWLAAIGYPLVSVLGGVLGCWIGTVLGTSQRP